MPFLQKGLRKVNDFLNKEGYPDPTPHEALKNIRNPWKRFGFRPLVYICSAYAGNTDENAAKARMYMRFAMAHNRIPVASHVLYHRVLDDGNPEERDLGLFFGKVLLGFCKEVWVFGENLSKGMKGEVNFAKKQNKPIRYFSINNNEITEVI